MKTIRAILTAAAIATFAWAVQPAAGQSSMMPATPEKGVWLEVSHSNFDAFEASFPSSVMYLSGRVPVTDRLSAVADLPFSYARMTLLEDAGSQSNSVLGNPFLGVEYAATERLLFDGGFRAPLTTADEESFADLLAFMADPHRAEAFWADMVPVSAGVAFQQPLRSDLSVRARAGATTFFHTGDEVDGSDTAVDYGLVGTYTSGIARLGLGASGRWFATADDAEEDEAFDTSVHYASLTGDVLVGRVRPGVSIRLPLDKEYRSVVNSTIGLYLQVPLR